GVIAAHPPRLFSLMPSPIGKAFWRMTNPFRYCVRLSAGWRLSPYPAYKKLQYQTVMQLAVGPRKRSAAGQALKIALCLQSDCLPLLGRHSGG
ncbi:hypothetical protein, partial [Klebsiella pneumoniae]|uniref:hypothetical protein n=1 Tax=Klebsiella pneumoniae TaxID=573 RepID=UPI001C6E1138